ncbi:uncharacterized membrane protein C3orf80 homolog [Chanos chanos]|uniref:Uncharacterized membrane protein C3orf80 homolog n=1 Tax=Chanos chanos TaxID=29144 RepID=A0A6J2VPE3_CHACN|nr:uncharacterized membrane protein C3orf80 homolog [Chanos chanos]
MISFPNDIRTCITFLTTFGIYACQALRNCGDIQCDEDERCCTQGNGSATVRCCRLPLHTFFDNIGWIARKLSGILILLLLFAMGYFIQRIICPRPRRHHDRPEDPSLLHGHITASQDSLLDRIPEYSVGDFTSPVLQLPAYDEVKYLPTYEETMQEVDRDRSDDNLLAASHGHGTVPGIAMGMREERMGNSNAVRISRNSV